MISLGLKDWFAKVTTTPDFGANLPIYVKFMAQHMAQQQEVSLKTSSQSSDLYPRLLVEMFMDIEVHEEWIFTYILEILIYCENEKYHFDEVVCSKFSNVKFSIGLQ